ncbi:hypothetical protein L3Q72_16040 [Vibrio sp. JC009]|uniref:hypothetical protein n=1 Tax=Vibrio sp. JC009 TaxID=2912314 RepID=UPI0023B02B59|nr:hypothetical protein [Vibrio sp. JC009]WED24387.1 hypothetical protein L3Q72_16040 [Vibrio sp. JC009]
MNVVNRRQSVKKHTKRNFREIVSSTSCGCISCARIFEPCKIVEWDSHSTTAVCPYCEAKQVIGSASGFPITEEFLIYLNGNKSHQQHVASRYRSSYSLPSLLAKSVAFQDINSKK